MQYTTAKISAALIAFLMPWLCLIVAIVVMTLASDQTPDGGIPFFVALMYVLPQQLLYSSRATNRHGVGTLGGRRHFGHEYHYPRLLPVVGRLSGVREYVDGAAAVWTPEILTVIGIEAGIGVLCIGLAFYFQSRKKDFI